MYFINEIIYLEYKEIAQFYVKERSYRQFNFRKNSEEKKKEKSTKLFSSPTNFEQRVSTPISCKHNGYNDNINFDDIIVELFI